jgi:hypothetical protein
VFALENVTGVLGALGVFLFLTVGWTVAVYHEIRKLLLSSEKLTTSVYFRVVSITRTRIQKFSKNLGAISKF